MSCSAVRRFLTSLRYQIKRESSGGPEGYFAFSGEHHLREAHVVVVSQISQKRGIQGWQTNGDQTGR